MYKYWRRKGAAGTHFTCFTSKKVQILTQERRSSRPHAAMYMSSYCYISVLILPYVCPHTASYVSSYCYICVLILLHMSSHCPILPDLCPHTAMCPHTAIHVSSYCFMCPHTATYVSSYCYICVLILLYMCPHTAIYVSSYWCICVRSPGTADARAYVLLTKPLGY